jgi:hypothetical protein
MELNIAPAFAMNRLGIKKLSFSAKSVKRHFFSVLPILLVVKTKEELSVLVSVGKYRVKNPLLNISTIVRNVALLLFLVESGLSFVLMNVNKKLFTLSKEVAYIIKIIEKVLVITEKEHFFFILTNVSYVKLKIKHCKFII